MICPAETLFAESNQAISKTGQWCSQRERRDTNYKITQSGRVRDRYARNNLSDIQRSKCRTKNRSYTTHQSVLHCLLSSPFD